MDGLLTIDGGLVFWTLTSFVLLLLVLGKFAWGPILAALEKREKTIADSVQAAEQAKGDAERLLEENRKLLAQAQDEANAIREKATKDAEARAAKIFEEAQGKAEAQLERARREIALEEERAVASVRKEAVDLSIEAASRLLRRSVSSDDHRRLVEEFLSDVEKKGIS